MPYMDKDSSMIIILPDACDGLSDLEQSLRNFNITSLFESFVNNFVTLTMPKFTIESEINLETPLKQVNQHLLGIS